MKKVTLLYSLHYPCKKKLLLFKCIFFVLHHHFCFILEVEGVLFFLMVSCLHKKFQTESLYYIWIMRQLLGQKKLKAERSKWFHCKTSRFLLFQCKLLKKLRKIYSKFVGLSGKIINVIQSLSFRLYEIIINYLFSVI